MMRSSASPQRVRRWWPYAGFAAFSCVLALAPGAASAQGLSVGDCRLVRSGGATSFNRPAGIVSINGGAVFACPNRTTIRADSVLSLEGPGRIYFVGNFRFADSLKVMTANYAEYDQAAEQLYASGNVVLSDAATGSVIRTPDMTYYRRNAQREEDLIVISRGRPTALLIQAGAQGAAPDTTEVVSEAMTIQGESRFLANGNAVITRADVKAYAGSAEFNQAEHELLLNGNARIEGETFEMNADSITALTDESNRIRDLAARGSAQLVSSESDLRVTAPFVTIALVEGEVERLVAVAPPSGPALPGPPGEAVAEAPAPARGADSLAVRARAESKEFKLAADSIDAVLPARQLERVTAVGTAFAERLDSDSARAELPPVLRRDWMSGDTIVARFAAAETNDTTSERVIESLDASAGQQPAAALSLLREEGGADGPSFAYQIAGHIRVIFNAGQIAEVLVDDIEQAYHFQPDGAVRRPAGGASGRGGGAGARIGDGQDDRRGGGE